MIINGFTNGASDIISDVADYEANDCLKVVTVDINDTVDMVDVIRLLREIVGRLEAECNQQTCKGADDISREFAREVAKLL